MQTLTVGSSPCSSDRAASAAADMKSLLPVLYDAERPQSKCYPPISPSAISALPYSTGSSQPSTVAHDIIKKYFSFFTVHHPTHGFGLTLVCENIYVSIDEKAQELFSRQYTLSSTI